MADRSKGMKHKQYKLSDLMYLCKFYEMDGPEMMAVVLDRPPKSLAELVRKLRISGQFDYYRRLWDQWYEVEARKAE